MKKKILILTVMLFSVFALVFAEGAQDSGSQTQSGGTQTQNNGTQTNATQTALSGTYRYGANAYVTFTGSNFTGRWNSAVSISGTYSVSGSRLTLNMTGGRYAGNTWTWTVANANTLRDQDGDSWTKGGGTQTDTNWVASSAFPAAWYAPYPGSTSTHWCTGPSIYDPSDPTPSGQRDFFTFDSGRKNSFALSSGGAAIYRISGMTANGQGIKVIEEWSGNEIILCTGWTVRNNRLTLTGGEGVFAYYNGKALYNVDLR